MNIEMHGIVKIERVVALLDVWLDQELIPIQRMKVKVVERNGPEYLALTNLHRISRESQPPEYISGLGDTIDDAVKDLLHYFIRDIQKYRPAEGYSLDEFGWSEPDDF